MAFNGGKMFHIFKLRDDHTYLPEFDWFYSKEVLENCEFYMKIDGANHCLFKENDQWIVGERYDDKKEKFNNGIPPDFRSLPIGSNSYQHHIHHYYYHLLYPEKAGKKKRKIIEKMYALIEEKKEIIDKLANDNKYLTFEAVGKKFNKTPGIDEDVDIAIHCMQTLNYTGPRTFEGIQKYLLEEVCIEGIVVEYQGRYWKIRSDCFDKKCAFSQIRKRGIPNNFIEPVLLNKC
jgi:hypothetical protein